MDGKDLDALSRQGLYDLVWSEAVATLVPKYGISDVALKKRCARQDVLNESGELRLRSKSRMSSTPVGMHR